MTNELNEFVSYYLPNVDVSPLLDLFKEQKIKKNRHLLKPGMDCNYLAFIQKGIFRVYFRDAKDKQVITWFSFSGMVITDMLGYYTTGKAQFYVEALGDSILYKISKQDLGSLYRRDPVYSEFGRKFAEEALTMLMQRTLSLHTKSAEDRYKELLQIPDLIQNVPLKYLATYLGITDTSLSRIRKKIR
jgi:CRP/FNR family transcriptional regulator, anaerobic regulatory protein